MTFTIVLLPGDGIGPEIVGEARRVLEAVAKCFGHRFEFQTHAIGGAAMDATGEPLPLETLDACRAADAILLGAVGGPRWDGPSASKRPEQGLLGLRKQLGLFANLRPIHAMPALLDSSPLRRDRVEGVDLVVVRELTGGIYFGEPRRRGRDREIRHAVDSMVYDEVEIVRVARVAFELARCRRGRLTSIDKANVLDCSRLWREVVTEVAVDYPDVDLEHQLVDSAAMRLITEPAAFDVVLTGNMFGDILSDEASVLTGSLGMLASASLGEGPLGLFEPAHGSAPDIAGQGIANPLATILSAALLLRHGLGLEIEAQSVEEAVRSALEAGLRTRDLARNGAATTAEAGERVRAGIERSVTRGSVSEL